MHLTETLSLAGRIMKRTSRRHSNSDFSLFINLVLADVLMAGLFGMIFLSITPPDDQGLEVRLPPFSYVMGDTLRLPSSAILHLDLDSTSQLSIDSIPHGYSSAEIPIYNFIMKRFLRKQKAYLWIRVDRATSYRRYIQLRDDIKRAEKTILTDLAIRLYGLPYSDDMPLLWRKRLYAELSLCIIEEDELREPYFEPRLFSDC